LKVCLISDFAKTGGAAIAADRIARALHQVGCNIHRISSNAPASSTFQEYSLQESRKLQLLMTLSGNKFLSFNIKKRRRHDLLRQLRKTLAAIKPDFISLHNIHGTDWPMDLAAVALDQCPTSWTLHDCSTFLGSYYPDYCSHATKDSLVKIENFWRNISSHESNARFSSIAPSNWMKSMAQGSYWGNYKSCQIPYPIFDEYNSNSEPEACKKALGLDPGKITVLIVAGNLNEERKGGPILKDILKDKRHSQLQFLLIGELDSEKNMPPNVKSMGFVKDDELKRIAYTCADITLHPAPIDNLPNTVIESVACGTPVIAFSSGGLKDMVIPQKTGWLVQEMGASFLSDELQKITKNRSFESIKIRLLEERKGLFSPLQVAENYIEHFNSLVQT
jgi:glycosyltransferase involved in cell wall biosynthesis